MCKLNTEKRRATHKVRKIIRIKVFGNKSEIHIKRKIKPLLYNFRRCCTDVIAPRTESLKWKKRKDFVLNLLHFLRKQTKKKLILYYTIVINYSNLIFLLPVNSAFNIRWSPKFISQHLGNTRYLIFGWNDKRNHTGSITIREELLIQYHYTQAWKLLWVCNAINFFKIA